MNNYKTENLYINDNHISFEVFEMRKNGDRYRPKEVEKHSIQLPDHLLDFEVLEVREIRDYLRLRENNNNNRCRISEPED